MRTLITGMSGTVAPVLADHLRGAGHSIVAWDRSAAPIDRVDAVRAFILRTRPDRVFHVATGPAEWAGWIARVCAEYEVPLLFTSSVSVFADTQQGPFDPDSVPEPGDEYGRYKLDCERRIRAAHPKARIARLGWQIGAAPGSNNMVDYLETTNRAEGRIEASLAWYPACSFLQDTAAALGELMRNHPAGVYHLDGNPGYSLFDIATRLNEIHGSHWNVTETKEPARNTRMIDPRLSTVSIADRLGFRAAHD